MEREIETRPKFSKRVNKVLYLQKQKGEFTMRERQEVLNYGMTFPDTYMDAPFHDANWVLLRYKKNKRAFAWTYERNGYIWVNVKVDPLTFTQI